MKTVLATQDVYHGNGAANLNHGFIYLHWTDCFVIYHRELSLSCPMHFCNKLFCK